MITQVHRVLRTTISIDSAKLDILVDGYEVRYQGICQQMLTMSAGYSGMPEASRTTSTTTGIKVEMGRFHNGLRGRFFFYDEMENFDLGYSRPFDQVGAFHSNQEYTHDGLNGCYRHEGNCVVAWSSSINHVRSGSTICIQILAIITKGNEDEAEFEHDFSPTN